MLSLMLSNVGTDLRKEFRTHRYLIIVRHRCPFSVAFGTDVDRTGFGPATPRSSATRYLYGRPLLGRQCGVLGVWRYRSCSVVRTAYGVLRSTSSAHARAVYRYGGKGTSALRNAGMRHYYPA